MKTQSRLDRYQIFAQRKVYAFFKSLEYNRLKGRVNGAKVLVNSIPKAGTNLLDRAIYEMPGLRFSGKRTLREFTHSKNRILKILKDTKRGVYHLGHIEYDKDIAQALQDNNFRTLLMVRDPRSVIVSHFKYVTYIDTNHQTHEYFKGLKNDEARIQAIINGVEGVVEPIEKIFNTYIQWLNEDCLLVRFEDLIGAEGGGSETTQNEVVQSLATHIGIELNDSQMNDISKKVFNKNSPTFRSGKIRGWEEYFSKENKEILKKSLGNRLIQFGYEQDFNW